MPILTVYQCEKCKLKFNDEANVVVSKGGKVLCNRCLEALLGDEQPRKYHRRRVRDLTQYKNNKGYYNTLREYLRKCREEGKLAFEPHEKKGVSLVVLIYDEYYTEVMQGIDSIDAQYRKEQKKDVNI